jgi:hypothetical protein
LLDLLLLLLNFAQLGLLLPVIKLLLHPDPGLLPDGGYRAVFHGIMNFPKFIHQKKTTCVKTGGFGNKL